MKQLLNGVMLMMLFAIAATSCKKDENKIYFEGGTAPVLSASTDQPEVLLLENANKEAVKLTWTNPSYNFTTGTSSQNVTYVLELDTAGANFASGVKKSYSITSDLSRSFTVSELNVILVSAMGLSVDEPHTIEARVTSSINSAGVTALVSNVISLVFTPYDQPVSISYMYVPGNYQGWSPPTAPSLGSFDTKNYEGYVPFTEANGEYKLTSDPDWDHTNYGDGGSAGTLSATGGNLKLAGDAGYYLYKVNLQQLTYTTTKTTWAIIGAATAGGWDNETALTYNATDKTWEIASIALAADEFKFRANNAWDINYGADSNGGSYLVENGSNLRVPEAGNYKVVLDLSHPLQYTYTLIKL